MNMDVYEDFLFNYASIVTTIIATVTATIITINKLRLRRPVSANCWFCNTTTKISRCDISWWQCQSCDQYNGFAANGDYNYDIPEQRKRSLNNVSVYRSSCRPEKPYRTSKTTLCQKCNRNETLKISQMRSLNGASLNDREIRIYRDSLEDQYPLCPKCTSLVKSILQKQSTWLTHYKMLLFKQRPITMNNSKKLETIFKIILTLLSCIIMGQPKCQALPIIGALLQLLFATKKFNSKITYHVLLILVWLGVCSLMPHCDKKLFELGSTWFTLDCITGQHVIAVLSVVLGLSNATLSDTPVSSLNVSFKKMDNWHEPEVEKAYLSDDDDDDDIETSGRKSPVNITDLLTTPSLKPLPTIPNLNICHSQLSHATLEQPEKLSLNDSLRTLSSLSLSDRDDKSNLKNCRVFETKTYGTTSPELFRRNCRVSKKFVLSPPKLKSVSQNSWVAGGYWQMGMDTPTLSRSSSQSSGFGSTGSNFANSREPSVVNDIDRYSVMSDTTLCCNYQPQSLATVNCCQYTGSGCREVPVWSPAQSLVSSTSCAMSQRTMCHRTTRHLADQCLKSAGQTLIPEVPICVPVSQPTVLASPIWIPVLVCGSLMINLVVVCTLLLR